MANLHYIAPNFIVANLQTSISFYVDKLGFELRFIGPPDDNYFAIVGREKISIFLKVIAPNILPTPNHTRHGWARLDAFIYVANPDALFEEYQSRGLSFHQPLRDDEDNLRGF